MSNQIPPKRLAFFERYLTVWVFLCMVVGVAFGKLAPGFTETVSKVEFVSGSHVNAPIAVLIWLMNSTLLNVSVKPGASLPKATPTTMHRKTQTVR